MAGDFYARVKSYRHVFSKSEANIADYCLMHGEELAQLSIQEVSKAIPTSTATLSRFAKHIGYQSFQEMKMAIVQSTKHTDLFEEISIDDSLLTISQRVFSENQQSLVASSELLTEKQFEEALEFIQSANRLFFFGIGGSGAVALDGFHKFMRTPIQCHFQQDFHIQLMEASQLSPTDCAIVISHTGKNQDILRIVDELLKNQVPIIAITSHAGSPLALQSDVCFISIAEETNYRSESLSAVIAQLSILDSLFVMYSLRLGDSASTTLDKVRQTIKTTRVK